MSLSAEKPTRLVQWLDPTKGWFVAYGSQVVGPLSVRDLHNAIRDGRVQPCSWLWQEGLGRWARAQDLEMLWVLWEALPGPPVLPDEAETIVDHRVPDRF